MIILIASFCLPIPAECSEWSYLHSSKGLTYYYEVIEEPNQLSDIKIVLQKILYDQTIIDKLKEARGYLFRDFTECICIFGINCANKLYKKKAVFYYDSSGVIIERTDYPDTGDWNKIRNNSEEYLLYKKACPPQKTAQ